ncbi:hypothetical protein C6W10_08745 [Plantactinospora sp. BB1]|nr:hypothetical protein C6W10_08745 [Plantactinospora sp. BB1]
MCRNRRSLAGCALTLAVLVLAGAPGAAADPSPPAASTAPQVGVSVRLLDAPVNRREDSRAYHYIVDHVKPGTTVRRRIVVSSASEIRREVAVYPAAATVDKATWVVAPDRTANELSSWVTVDRNRLDLDPDERATVWTTIRVPEDAAAGERYAVLWAQTAGLADSTVRHIGRAGVRIYLSVGPGGEPASDFTITDLTGTRAPDGTATLTASVTNTGKRALDLDGTLQLKDGPDNLNSGPFKVEAPTLALGATATVQVPIGRNTPDGPWTAKLELASGWTRRTATGQVTFTRPGAVAKPADRSRTVLLAGLAGSAIVLALLVGYAVHQRRRADRPVPLGTGSLARHASRK